MAFARTEDGMEAVTVPTWWRVGAAEAGAPREVCEREMARSDFIPFRKSPAALTARRLGNWVGGISQEEGKEGLSLDLKFSLCLRQRKPGMLSNYRAEWCTS